MDQAQNDADGGPCLTPPAANRSFASMTWRPTAAGPCFVPPARNGGGQFVFDPVERYVAVYRGMLASRS